MCEARIGISSPIVPVSVLLFYIGCSPFHDPAPALRCGIAVLRFLFLAERLRKIHPFFDCQFLWASCWVYACLLHALHTLRDSPNAVAQHFAFLPKAYFCQAEYLFDDCGGCLWFIETCDVQHGGFYFWWRQECGCRYMAYDVRLPEQLHENREHSPVVLVANFFRHLALDEQRHGMRRPGFQKRMPQ